MGSGAGGGGKGRCRLEGGQREREQGSKRLEGGKRVGEKWVREGRVGRGEGEERGRRDWKEDEKGNWAGGGKREGASETGRAGGGGWA